ncbi:MAG: hypothetical protein ACUVRY_08830 [Thermoanaerobaculaceae bacterium]
MRRSILWLVTVLLTAGAAIWQRVSGPSWPVVGSFQLPDGRQVRYRLPRSAEVGRDLRVLVEVSGEAPPGLIRCRRVPSKEDWQFLPLAPQSQGGKQQLVAFLPAQPPAGKLAYQFLLSPKANAPEIPVPAQPVVVRFKGHVPLGLLVFHIGAMFFGMLLGNRVGVGAVLGEAPPKRLVQLTLACFIVGGLVLGPLVQKAAFGTFWSGFPVGRDLTDTKTLFFAVAWAAAAGLGSGQRRWPVVAAFLLTLSAFLVPHSVWGSEIRWDH